MFIVTNAVVSVTLSSVLSDSCFSHKTTFPFPYLALCMLVSSCFPSEHSTTFAHRFTASSFDVVFLSMKKICIWQCFKYFKKINVLEY